MTAPADRTVVVIGAGPAGLGAATELRRLGVGRVIVLERQAEPGGIPRHCGHSPFGMREFHRPMLGPAYARRLVAAARAAEVEVRTGHSVTGIGPGPVVSVVSDAGQAKMRADAVVLATGLRETTRAAALLPGGRMAGILNTAALQDMMQRGLPAPFRRPVILGSELVTNSAILTCRLHGIRPVALVERATAPLLRAPLSWFPRLTGLPRNLGAQVEDIEGEAQVRAVTIRDAGGQRHRLDCDGLLLTGQFVPEAAMAGLSGVALDPGTGGPEVDTLGRTTQRGIWAAGNVLRGVETAGWSWQEGVWVARAIVAQGGAADGPTDAPADGPTDTFGDGPSGTSYNGPSGRGLPLVAGAGVARLVPQRLGPVTSAPEAFRHIQLRMTDRVRGRLLAHQGGSVVWSAPLRSGPERRVLVPVAALRAVATGDGPVTLSADPR